LSDHAALEAEFETPEDPRTAAMPSTTVAGQ